MKELSIEQKAHRYDEALDKVAHFIKKHIGFGCMIHPNSSEAKELFNIFPELRESDDERIRKEIIQYIKTGTYHKDWIAWLEKQNHDGKKWIYEDVYLNEKEQMYQDGVDDVLENPQKYGLEKQGEQKELKKIENEVEIPFSSKDSELQEVTYYIPKGFHAEIDDDKVVIKKGEKPAWSEEDENKLNEILLDIECSRAIHLHSPKGTFDSRKNWLKSIKDRVQPQNTWEPSDEQMDALETATSSLQSTALESLYNELKKLRKE